MMRGTFANIRIRNEIIPNTEGGVTHSYISNGKDVSIYDAAMEYAYLILYSLVIFAGKEYGTGSSRDWAAKGTRSIRSKSSYCRIFWKNSSLKFNWYGGFTS